LNQRSARDIIAWANPPADPGFLMSIQEQVLSFIHRPEPGRFDSLALDVFRSQYVSVPAYRRYCDGLGILPETLSSPDRIPLVSTVAFKYASLCAPDSVKLPGALTFLTSGTTRGRQRRGHHVVARAEIYRASALSHMRATMFPDGARMRMLAIHPTADRMPESSLSMMITWCIAEFGQGPSLCAADRLSLDVQAALAFFRRATEDAAPVCILGTTAAYAAIFHELAARGEAIALRPLSRMMDTGGPKGQMAPLGAGEVVELARDLLGMDPAHVINEYGMTELCSQLYDATEFNAPGEAARARVKLAPPWMRPLAIDPVTLRHLPDGTRGLLGFIDLANVNSVSAVLTEDFGMVHEGRVSILGRASVGGPRGCALSVAQFEGTARA
jgi:Acyl-protein synthetase, LuxE